MSAAFSLYFRSGPHTIPVDLKIEVGGVELPLNLTGATAEVYLGTKPAVDITKAALIVNPVTVLGDPIEGKAQFQITFADTEVLGIGKRYLQVITTAAGVITAMPVVEFEVLSKVQNTT